MNLYALCVIQAQVVELVDTYASGAYASRLKGSSPFLSTILKASVFHSKTGAFLY